MHQLVAENLADFGARFWLLNRVSCSILLHGVKHVYFLASGLGTLPI